MFDLSEHETDEEDGIDEDLEGKSAKNAYRDLVYSLVLAFVYATAIMSMFERYYAYPDMVVNLILRYNVYAMLLATFALTFYPVIRHRVRESAAMLLDGILFSFTMFNFLNASNIVVRASAGSVNFESILLASLSSVSIVIVFAHFHLKGQHSLIPYG
jgi:hypothetical protein